MILSTMSKSLVKGFVRSTFGLTKGYWHLSTQPDQTLFFSHLLTCEAYLIEVLEIMAQMWYYVYNFFKPETNKGEFSLYIELFEKKL